jgi:hypothetical protein
MYSDMLKHMEIITFEELRKLVGSNGSLSQPFMLKVMMFNYFVSHSHKVIMALILLCLY